MPLENPNLKVSEVTTPHEIAVNRGGIRKIIIASSIRNGVPMAYYGTAFHLQIEREDGVHIEPHDLEGNETVEQILSSLFPEQAE
ncbi:MAG: hypothetical protein PHU71_01920 [Candidatus Gracilibacteria bacterium]|nr:hypothetical protein [Candidatus Gracilibacteria bacterium]